MAKKGRNNPPPPRNTNESFLRDTAHMIEKLAAARNQVSAKQLQNANVLSSAEKQLTSGLDARVNELLPNLDASSISVLKRDAGDFYNAKRVAEQIRDARRVRASFWVWLSGGSPALKRGVLNALHERLKTDLRSWLSTHGSSVANQRVAELRNEKAALDTQYRELSDRIKNLSDVQKRFSGPGAPTPPKDLSSAVSRSSNQMRANPSIVTTTVVREDTFWRDMWLIDELNERHYRESRRYDDDRFNRRDGGSYYEPSPWGAPSRETRDPDYSRPQGRSSSRAEEVAPAPEGRSSSRASDAAPAEEGRSSFRASDAAPVIADPFKSEGRSSFSMSRETRDDAPTSRGTSY